jgi:hypothetical protein
MAAVGPLPCRGTGPRLLTGGKLGSVPVNALGRGSAKADAATGVQAGFDSPGSLRARRAGVGPVELMAARVGQVAVAESYVLRQPPLPHPAKAASGVQNPWPTSTSHNQPCHRVIGLRSLQARSTPPPLAQARLPRLRRLGGVRTRRSRTPAWHRGPARAAERGYEATDRAAVIVSIETSFLVPVANRPPMDRIDWDR